MKEIVKVVVGAFVTYSVFYFVCLLGVLIWNAI